MAIFRNIVFIAALAGLVAGLAMTAMQYAGTIPLILKAETFEGAAPAHDHALVMPPHRMRRLRPTLTITTKRVGLPRMALSAQRIRLSLIL